MTTATVCSAQICARADRLDELARGLLAILSEIETAAKLAEVLVDDPAEREAWAMIRDKAASGGELYRQAKYPAREEDKVGDVAE